jgi:hypothetical protein
MRRQKSFRVDVTLYGVRDSTLFAGADIESDVLHIRGVRAKAVTVANAAPASSVLAQGIGYVRCDDGLLEFVAVTSSGLASLFRAMIDLLRSALMRKRTTRGDILGLRARRIEISCDPPQRVVVDGEEAGLTPVLVELDADASKRQIEVIAPKAGFVTKRRRRLSRALLRFWRNARGVTLLSVAVFALRNLRERPDNESSVPSEDESD